MKDSNNCADMTRRGLTPPFIVQDPTMDASAAIAFQAMVAAAGDRLANEAARIARQNQATTISKAYILQANDRLRITRRKDAGVVPLTVGSAICPTAAIALANLDAASPAWLAPTLVVTALIGALLIGLGLASYIPD